MSLNDYLAKRDKLVLLVYITNRRCHMTHQEIFDYALSVYNVALGVDEIIHIVSNNLNVDHFVSNKYPSVA